MQATWIYHDVSDTGITRYLPGQCCSTRRFGKNVIEYVNYIPDEYGEACVISVAEYAETTPIYAMTAQGYISCLLHN